MGKNSQFNKSSLLQKLFKSLSKTIEESGTEIKYNVFTTFLKLGQGLFKIIRKILKMSKKGLSIKVFKDDFYLIL